MKRPLALCLLAAGCLDFGLLDTPFDGGAPSDGGGADLAPVACIVPDDGGTAPECDASTDCPGGRTCTNYGVGPSLCLLPCTLDVDCPCDHTVCLDGQVCGRFCDPIAQTGCRAGEACDILVVSGVATTACRLVGNQLPGAACKVGMLECRAGLSCLVVNNQNVCVPLCRIKPTPSACPMGSCHPTNNPIYQIGDIEWGGCA